MTNHLHMSKVEQMACGNCGHGSFSIGKHSLDGQDSGFIIHTMCQKCGAVSTIDIVPPRLDIGWANGNDKGCLAEMKPDSY